MPRKTPPLLEKNMRENAAPTHTCRRCGEEKPTSDFRINCEMGDGIDYYCRACRKQLERDRRGGTTRLLAKFTDKELLAELTRRNLIAEKLDELGRLISNDYIG